MNEMKGLKCFYVSCSGEVLAGQEEGPEVEQSSCCHPERLEGVEGEIWKHAVIEVLLKIFIMCIVPLNYCLLRVRHY